MEPAKAYIRTLMKHTDKNSHIKAEKITDCLGIIFLDTVRVRSLCVALSLRPSLCESKIVDKLCRYVALRGITAFEAGIIGRH